MGVLTHGCYTHQPKKTTMGITTSLNHGSYTHQPSFWTMVVIPSKSPSNEDNCNGWSVQCVARMMSRSKVSSKMAGKCIINLEVSYCKDQPNKWECSNVPGLNDQNDKTWFWLVVSARLQPCFIFHNIWDVILQNWRTPSFFRGVGQPPTSDWRPLWL